MGASKTTVDQIIKVMLKHVDRKTALKISRDLHNKVSGNRSVVETFARIAEQLAHMEEEE